MNYFCRPQRSHMRCGSNAGSFVPLSSGPTRNVKGETSAHRLYVSLCEPGGERYSLANSSGNILVVASTTSTVIALTWGGIQFAWSSVNILVPLILGLLGLCAFLVFEGRFARNPMVSFFVLISDLKQLRGGVGSI
jgi:hypothetical protein